MKAVDMISSKISLATLVAGAMVLGACTDPGTLGGDSNNFGISIVCLFFDAVIYFAVAVGVLAWKGTQNIVKEQKKKAQQNSCFR